MTDTRSAVVIGGGISGLTAALELEAGGRDVRVFEASPRIGGAVQTRREGGYVFENGPNWFPDTSSELVGLAERVGISDRVITSSEASATRLVYHNHRLLPVPMGPRELMRSEIFTPGQKLRLLMERFVPRGKKDQPESVAHFFYRRFGAAPTRTLVDAFVSGIYAGDARRVGLRSAFPVLYRMEREHGSILKALRVRANKPSSISLCSFETGLSDLTEAIAGRLRSPIHVDTAVKSLTAERDGYRLVVEHDGVCEEVRADEVVISTPASTAGLLLAGLNSMVADLLFDVEYAGILSIQAGFSEGSLPDLPKAFGFLAPRPQRLRTLGWLFTSRIFAGRAPDGHHALSGFIGGAQDQQIMRAPEEAIRHLVLGELALALRMTKIPQPDDFRLVSHDPGLPQHDLGHYRRVDAIQKLLADRSGLKIIGNYIGGVSLNDCVKTARAAAVELLEAKPPAATGDAA